MKHIEIEGVPLPQLRHRDSRHGGKYDPCSRAKSDFAIKAACQWRPKELLISPLAVCLVFNMPRPGGHYLAHGRLSGKAPYWHVIEPDSDNLAKFVLDALTGYYWKDDKIICCLVAIKPYIEDKPPSTEVIISWELNLIEFFSRIQQCLLGLPPQSLSPG